MVKKIKIDGYGDGTGGCHGGDGWGKGDWYPLAPFNGDGQGHHEICDEYWIVGVDGVGYSTWHGYQDSEENMVMSTEYYSEW